jgi:NAD(P)H dehydrogenase (quinone)
MYKIVGSGQRPNVASIGRRHRLGIRGTVDNAAGAVTISATTHSVTVVLASSPATAAAEHWVEMAIAGEDPWWMYAYSTMFASIREQRWAAVSDEVHRLTGCLPVPVRKTLARYKTA